MTEQSIITAIASRFPRSPNQRHQPFECDAEVVARHDGYDLFTIDEFSQDEDQFTTENPARLGANLATATLSDIIAAGGTPTYFMHAICLPPNTLDDFAHALATGIASALDHADCHLLGGDLGQAPTWRFTGWAMGTSQRPLTRILPREHTDLWISGPLGGANAAIAAHTPTPRFESRLPFADILQAHATTCIDTSSGLWDALWTLQQLNPEHQIQLTLADVPLAASAIATCNHANLPKAAALIGAAGEYELLFAAPPQAETAVRATGATRIGHASPAHPAGFLVQTPHGPIPAPPCPDPRSFADRTTYLTHVFEAAHTLNGTMP
jgi:thiamine-monophosphate kinase